MNTLKTEFRKDGFDYVLLKRTKDLHRRRADLDPAVLKLTDKLPRNVALFRQTKGRLEVFEVALIQVNDARVIEGKEIPASESLPPSEGWGAYGWTLLDPKKAEERYEALAEEQTRLAQALNPAMATPTPGPVTPETKSPVPPAAGKPEAAGPPAQRPATPAAQPTPAPAPVNPTAAETNPKRAARTPKATAPKGANLQNPAAVGQLFFSFTAPAASGRVGSRRGRLPGKNLRLPVKLGGFP